MAVCGHCWICREKFDCSPMRCCEKNGGPLVLDLLPRVSAKICLRCVTDIESGALSALVAALRAALPDRVPSRNLEEMPSSPMLAPEPPPLPETRKTAEQIAREMLHRIGVATYFPNGHLVELGNLISIARTVRRRQLEKREALTATDHELFRRLAAVMDALERDR